MGALAMTTNGEERQDGFGWRSMERDREGGEVEVLDVSAPLATPASEQAIRTRASRLTACDDSPFLARVVRVTRTGQTLSVRSAVPDAVSLADLLAALEFGTVRASDHAILELTRAMMRALAALHEMPGAPSHGALTPGHLWVRGDGRVMLGGAVFADALQGLQCNREQLWRTFAIAMPFSAGLPRFEVRSDVTQMGALVLATLLRRQLNAAEYPNGVADLVAAGAARYSCGLSLQLWLQQALQLHTKALFSSAVDAGQAYGRIVPQVSGARAELRNLVRQMRGDQPTTGSPPGAGGASAGPAFPQIAAS